MPFPRPVDSTLHGVVDYSGRYRKGTGKWVPHVALCPFELASLAMTDPTGKGDFHGDVEAVRAGNMEDPHRKIYDGKPAVTPAAA